MDRRWIVPRGVLGVLSLFLASGLIASATADPIRPWEGGGARASANDYSGSVSHSIAEDSGERSHAYARVGENPGNLLQVRSSARQVELSPFPNRKVEGAYAYASGVWLDDIIRVGAAGNNIPDYVNIKLGFDMSVDFDNAWSWTSMDGWGSTLRVQGLTSSHDNYNPGWNEDWSILGNWKYNLMNLERHGYEGLAVLESTYEQTDHGLSVDWASTRTFKLMLDDSGVSDPFDLELSASTHTEEDRVFQDYAVQVAATLSLLDITLPDGTPLHEAGYSVAFDSGLAWPQPVPEPAPIALLGVGMALAGWKQWRKRAGA